MGIPISTTINFRVLICDIHFFGLCNTTKKLDFTAMLYGFPESASIPEGMSFEITYDLESLIAEIIE